MSKFLARKIRTINSVRVSLVFVPRFSQTRNLDELEQCSFMYKKLGAT